MSSEISRFKNSNNEEARMRNYRDQLLKRFELEIRDMEMRHQDEVVQMANSQAQTIENLRHAYDVRISEEGEALEEKLRQVKINSDERIEAEKRAGEAEFGKIRMGQQKRIEEYKKNADEQMAALQKRYQASTAQLHEQAKKTTRKEKETSNS
jgi:hypothetical protein